MPKVKKPRKGAKGGAASSAEESEGEKMLDEDEAAPRPKPKRATRANPVVEEAAALDEGNQLYPVTPKARPRPRQLHRDKTTRANPVVDEEALDEGNNFDPVTPKSRLRSIHRDKTPTGSLHGSENEQNPFSGSPLSPVAPSDGEQGLREGPNNGIATPKSSLKRPRTGDDGALEVLNGTPDPDHLINVDGTPDMQVRRKRIRH